MSNAFVVPFPVCERKKQKHKINSWYYKNRTSIHPLWIHFNLSLMVFMCFVVGGSGFVDDWTRTIESEIKTFSWTVGFCLWDFFGSGVLRYRMIGFSPYTFSVQVLLLQQCFLRSTVPIFWFVPVLEFCYLSKQKNQRHMTWPKQRRHPPAVNVSHCQNYEYMVFVGIVTGKFRNKNPTVQRQL